MDLKYMEEAFKYAEIAFNENEVPIGAVIVKDNQIISFGYNKKEQHNDVLSHAELNAIRDASKILKNWRLDGCDMYVTLDPCPMCASAIKQSRITNVYSALSNSYVDNARIIDSIFKSYSSNSSVNFVSDLYVDKSKDLLRLFFEKQRSK